MKCAICPFVGLRMWVLWNGRRICKACVESGILYAELKAGRSGSRG